MEKNLENAVRQRKQNKRLNEQYKRFSVWVSCFFCGKFPVGFLRTSRALNVISRLMAITESTTLDHVFHKPSTDWMSRCRPCLFVGMLLAQWLRTSSTTHESGKENSICNDFRGARKSSLLQSWLFHASRMYGFEEGSRVSYFSCSVTDPACLQRKEKERGWIKIKY